MSSKRKTVSKKKSNLKLSDFVVGKQSKRKPQSKSLTDVFAEQGIHEGYKETSLVDVLEGKTKVEYREEKPMQMRKAGQKVVFQQATGHKGLSEFYAGVDQPGIRTVTEHKNYYVIQLEPDYPKHVVTLMKTAGFVKMEDGKWHGNKTYHSRLLIKDMKEHPSLRGSKYKTTRYRPKNQLRELYMQ